MPQTDQGISHQPKTKRPGISMRINLITSLLFQLSLTSRTFSYRLLYCWRCEGVQRVQRVQRVSILQTIGCYLDIASTIIASTITACTIAGIEELIAPDGGSVLVNVTHQLLTATQLMAAFNGTCMGLHTPLILPFTFYPAGQYNIKIQPHSGLSITLLC